MEKKQYKFLIAIIIGAILGALFGIFFPKAATNVGILGELFLNALKMIVLPLIITSMIVGITNLGNIRALGSVGLKTVIYYFVTTGIAVIIGIILVVIIQPGVGFEQLSANAVDMSDKQFSLHDLMLSLISPNLVHSASEFQILPLIVASIIFGIAITTIGSKGKILIDFFGSLNEVVMKIVHGIVLFTPIGVFALIANRLGVMGGGDAIFDVIARLGMYCLTVILGLLVHGLIVLPIILYVWTRRNPVNYIMHVGKALLTAFATASSSATLPVTMECVSEEAKVSKRISDVVLPVGATINMDGTALYEAVAAIFIAQAYGVELTQIHLVIIFLTATLAAIGAAGIPEAGLVTMVLVLTSVGLPTEGIGLILVIDWFLDRCRTTVNVWGDSIGAAVIDKSEMKAVVQ